MDWYQYSKLSNPHNKTKKYIPSFIWLQPHWIQHTTINSLQHIACTSVIVVICGVGWRRWNKIIHCQSSLPLPDGHVCNKIQQCSHLICKTFQNTLKNEKITEVSVIRHLGRWWAKLLFMTTMMKGSTFHRGWAREDVIKNNVCSKGIM